MRRIEQQDAKVELNRVPGWPNCRLATCAIASNACACSKAVRAGLFAHS